MMDWADETAQLLTKPYSKSPEIILLTRDIAGFIRAERVASNKRIAEISKEIGFKEDLLGRLNKIVENRDVHVAELEAQIARMREAGNHISDYTMYKTRAYHEAELHEERYNDCLDTTCAGERKLRAAWRAAEKGE